MTPVTDPELISEAVVIWTGLGRSPTPVRDEALLVERFGQDAIDVLPVVMRVVDEFYESNARHVAASVREMAEMSADDFRARHPDLKEEAVRALAWCYTYDYK